MILINDYWEMTNDLYDISRIIREHYNSELANELDELIKEFELDNEHYREEISSLQDALDYKDDEIDDLNGEINGLEDEIEELKNKIEGLKYQLSCIATYVV